MDVLWWLAAPLGVTMLAMVWAAWAGRSRADRPADDEARRERLAAALVRPVPAKARRIVTQRPAATGGVAVRPSARRPSSED